MRVKRKDHIRDVQQTNHGKLFFFSFSSIKVRKKGVIIGFGLGLKKLNRWRGGFGGGEQGRGEVRGERRPRRRSECRRPRRPGPKLQHLYRGNIHTYWRHLAIVVFAVEEQRTEARPEVVQVDQDKRHDDGLALSLGLLLSW